MKTIIYIYVLLFFSVFSFWGCEAPSKTAEKSIDKEQADHTVSSRDHKFPEDWLGTYRGTMEWHANGRLRAEVPLQLEILVTDEPNTWIWRSTYDSTKVIPRRIVKDYLIRQPDSLADHAYIMDEQNGILMDLIKLDNCFYSSFEVMNSRLLSCFCMVDGKIHHKIITHTSTVDRLSTSIEETDTIEIHSYGNASIQKAILSLVKE